MLKNLGRMVIILFAAGLIALGWYAFSTTAAGQVTEPDRRAEFTQRDEPDGDQLPLRPERGEAGFSMARILGGMAANTGIIALVIVLVVWLRRLVNRLTLHHFKFGRVKS
ncbi:MAG: hypothetical protein U0401_29540 [Anaerolineae bacterium]